MCSLSNTAFPHINTHQIFPLNLLSSTNHKPPLPSHHPSSNASISSLSLAHSVTHRISTATQILNNPYLPTPSLSPCHIYANLTHPWTHSLTLTLFHSPKRVLALKHRLSTPQHTKFFVSISFPELITNHLHLLIFLLQTHSSPHSLTDTHLISLPSVYLLLNTAFPHLNTNQIFPLLHISHTSSFSSSRLQRHPSHHSHSLTHSLSLTVNQPPLVVAEDPRGAAGLPVSLRGAIAPLGASKRASNPPDAHTAWRGLRAASGLRLHDRLRARVVSMRVSSRGSLMH